MTARPGITLVTIAVDTAVLEAFRASSDAAGLSWCGDESEVSMAAGYGIKEYTRMNLSMVARDAEQAA